MNLYYQGKSTVGKYTEKLFHNRTANQVAVNIKKSEHFRVRIFIFWKSIDYSSFKVNLLNADTEIPFFEQNSLTEILPASSPPPSYF